MKLRRDKVRQKVEATRGKIFGASFTKRTTNKMRVMAARVGVRKGVTGVGLSFDPVAKNLIVVFDMRKREFRMISIEGLKELRVRGRIYKVV